MTSEFLDRTVVSEAQGTAVIASFILSVEPSVGVEVVASNSYFYSLPLFPQVLVFCEQFAWLKEAEHFRPSRESALLQAEELPANGKRNRSL